MAFTWEVSVHHQQRRSFSVTCMFILCAGGAGFHGHPVNTDIGTTDGAVPGDRKLNYCQSARGGFARQIKILK